MKTLIQPTLWNVVELILFCFLFWGKKNQTVREKIGAIATPDYIQNAPGLPKTRSGTRKTLCVALEVIKRSVCLGLTSVSDLFIMPKGKIMRRVLRKIASNQQDLGDVSTLADSSVLEQLFENRCCTSVWTVKDAIKPTSLQGTYGKCNVLQSEWMVTRKKKYCSF